MENKQAIFQVLIWNCFYFHEMPFRSQNLMKLSKCVLHLHTINQQQKLNMLSQIYAWVWPLLQK